MHNLSYRGSNLVTAPALDTVSRWGQQKNLATTFYTYSDMLNNQPSQYGLLVNVTDGGSEVHQLWATQPNGNLAHRGGNGSGWSGSWKTILDSSNYSNYVTMPWDHVIETNIVGNFTYRKWNNGVSEAWYYEQLDKVPLTTLMAENVYSSTSYNGRVVTLPSGLFVAGSIPNAVANVYSNGYTCCQVASATSTQVSYRVWSPYSTIIEGCRVSIYITGKWK